jgi:hypothetical protein
MTTNHTIIFLDEHVHSDIVSLYENEHSIRSISLKYGITQSAVSKILVKCGVRLRTRSQARNTSKYIKEFANSRIKIQDPNVVQSIVDEYQSGVSTVNIGVKYGIHYNTVRLLLKRNNIKIRTCKEAQSHSTTKYYIKQSCFVKYGTSNVMHHPDFFKKSQKMSYRNKTANINGRTFHGLQGYEPEGIEYILSTYDNISVDDIEAGLNGNIPHIDYELHGKRRYFPDIYIPKYKMLFEVKSDYTYNKGLEKNKLKQKASKDSGYQHMFLIINKKQKSVVVV